ncbi:MAG: DUF3782 domain-containing protein, partial [Vulcanisaeta sp.]|nr:DUF3782 domain-containing protein [Vulcanisaeta sp.]
EAVNELTKLAKAHEERLAKLEERVAGVEDRLSRVEAAIEELTRAVKAHDERLARLESAVEELTKAVKAHEERLARLESAVEELTRAIKAHEERLAKLEERMTNVEDRLSRIEAAIEELTKIVKAHEERLAKVEDRLTRLETVVEKLANAVSVHSMRLDSFDRRLMALGARWGVESEEAFRNAMRGVVEGILGVATVGKWVYFDKDGVVYGYPSQVDVDVAIKDSTHILVEVKSSVSRGDVSEFSRVGRLYEMVTGIKPRLVMVTPFIDDRGLEAARTLGIEVYTDV